MEVHLDIVPTPIERETGASVIVEFEIRHTVDEFGGFGGVGNDFIEGLVIFDAIFEIFAKTNLFAEVNPVIFG